jgi:hypothetical protein
MSTADEGARLLHDGRPQRQGQAAVNEPQWRVFVANDPPPPADVEALVDRKGGYWLRIGPDCWNCPGNEPHTWHEMSPSAPFVAVPRLPTAEDVAAAAAVDWTQRKLRAAETAKVVRER